MKKSLVICHFYPLPEKTGGNIRTMNFAKYFKKMGETDIAYTHRSTEKEKNEFFFDQEYKFENTDYPSGIVKRMDAVLSGRPYPVRSYSDIDKIKIFNLIENKNYDYILVRYATNCYNFFDLPDQFKKRVLLDFDDLFSDSFYETLFYDSNNIIKRIIRNINKRLLLKYEKRCMNLNICIFSSKKDLKKAKENGKNGIVVPNIIYRKEFEEFDFGDGYKNRKILLFVGMLTYPPNISGLKWFIESIFPIVKEVHKDFKLFVVGYIGNSSDKEIKRLCSMHQDIELHTNVEDVRAYYKKAMAILVPILTGGGTRIKILEAALANRPVISTPIGAEGLELERDKDIKLFSDAAEFLKTIKEIDNYDVYKNLATNAKEIVNKKYSIKSFENSMNATLDKVEKRCNSKNKFLRQ